MQKIHIKKYSVTIYFRNFFINAYYIYSASIRLYTATTEKNITINAVPCNLPTIIWVIILSPNITKDKKKHK